MGRRSQSSALGRLESSRGPGGFSESPWCPCTGCAPQLVPVPLRVSPHVPESELGLQEEARDQQNIQRRQQPGERQRKPWPHPGDSGLSEAGVVIQPSCQFLTQTYLQSHCSCI